MARGGAGRTEQGKMVRGLVSSGRAKEESGVSLSVLCGYNLNVVSWLSSHVSLEW